MYLRCVLWRQLGILPSRLMKDKEEAHTLLVHVYLAPILGTTRYLLYRQSEAKQSKANANTNHSEPEGHRRDGTVQYRTDVI